MPAKQTCPECGTTRPAEAVSKPCPVCALQGALELSKGSPGPTIGPVSEPRGLESIGPYQLRQKLGEGGYGCVYLAEQSHPLRRRVALKIVKLGMDTKQFLARFEIERQALALMDHPNIAAVLDAGASDTGRPFFVMELVRGPRITDFCDQQKLSIRERLALFVQVCHGIQHAHQKGILHRDLKPSNILVAIQDGRSVPKIIDFGIAKALPQQIDDDTSLTSPQQFLGTPAYMSPEQAGLSRADIDTRSDIYSLGVLLYELLTGHVPFTNNDLAQAGLDQMLRIIREKEPARPSTRLNTLPLDQRAIVANNRGVAPDRLLHALRGDLDALVMKCLEKDRAQRYATANDLAADIDRYLADQVISASSRSTFHRVSKFVRRNRVGLATSAALFLLLTAGIVVSSWQAMRATRAEQEQRRLRHQAETQQHLLEKALVDVQAQKVRAESALAQMENEKAGKESALRESQQQRTNALLALMEANVAHGRAQLLLESARTANTRAEAALSSSRDQQASLESLLDFMLFDLSARLEPIGKVDLLRSVTEKVLDHYQAGDNQQQAVDGNAHRFAALKNLGHVLALQGDSTRALAVYRSCLEIGKDLSLKVPSAARWQAELSSCHRAIGSLLAKQGDFTQAVEEFNLGLDIADALQAQDPLNLQSHDLLQSCSAALADSLWALRERATAIAACRKAMKTSQWLIEHDPENLQWKLDLSAAYNRLGCFLTQESDIAGAQKACQSALEYCQQLALTNAGNQAVRIQLARSMDNLGDVLLADKQPEKALAHYKEALKIRQQTAQADPDNTEWQRDLLSSYFRVARAMVDENKTSKLAGIFQDGLKAMANVHKKHLQLAQQLFVPERPNARSMETLQDSLKMARDLADKDPANVEWQADLAQNYSLAGDIAFEMGETARALEQYERALQIRTDLVQGNSSAACLQINVAVAQARLAAAHEHSGEHDKALLDARQALGIMASLLSRWPDNLALLEIPGADAKYRGILDGLTPAQRSAFVAAFKSGYERAQKQASENLRGSQAEQDWAEYCSQLAVLDWLHNDFKAAAAHAEKAATLYRSLSQKKTANNQLQSGLRDARISACVLHLRSHNLDAAIRIALGGSEPGSIELKGLLAVGYLLRGEVEEAQRICMEGKDILVGPRKTFPDAVVADFMRLRETGVASADRQKADALLALNPTHAAAGNP